MLFLERELNLKTHEVYPSTLKADTKITNNKSWTFLTNHAHVLLYLAQNPFELIRDIAYKVGITERRVQRIISELEIDGYLKHVREGRRNIYKVFSRKPLRHSIEKHRQVQDLINLIKKE